MEQKAAFVANDGKVFLSEAECIQHEAGSKWDDLINAFIASGMSPYNKGPQIGVARRVIVAWEAWVAKQQPGDEVAPVATVEAVPA